jgi:hypothetical protein
LWGRELELRSAKESAAEMVLGSAPMSGLDSEPATEAKWELRLAKDLEQWSALASGVMLEQVSAEGWDVELVSEWEVARGVESAAEWAEASVSATDTALHRSVL